MSLNPMTTNLNTKIKRKFKTNLYVYMNHSTLENIVEDLQDAIKSGKQQGYENLEVQFEQNCGCYRDCSCAPSPVIYGIREETDEEFNKRVQERIKIQADQEAYERQQLLRLKKKYGV